jgi:hypothetical protein
MTLANGDSQSAMNRKRYRLALAAINRQSFTLVSDTIKAQQSKKAQKGLVSVLSFA